MKLFSTIIIFSLLIGCNSNRIKKPSLLGSQNDKEYIEFKQNQNFDSIIEALPNFVLPMSSDSISKLVQRNQGHYEIDSSFLNKNITYENNDNLFNNTTTVMKDDEFFFYEINDKVFYPLYKWKKGNHYIIGSLVKFYGENDIPGASFLISIFDKNGNQIDYLIAFNRFSWEINYEFDFTIDSLFIVKINKLIENYYDDEKDDFIEEGEKPETIRKTVHYNINDRGNFFKIKNKE